MTMLAGRRNLRRRFGGTLSITGENRETSDASASRVFAAYRIAVERKYKHIVAKPGEVLPITGMQVRVVAATGK